MGQYEKHKWIAYVVRKAKERLKSSVYTKEEFCHLFGVSSPEELNTQEMDFLRSVYLATIALGQNASERQREEYILQYNTIRDARTNNNKIYDLYNQMKSNLDAMILKMEAENWFDCDVYCQNILELSHTNVGNGYARLKLKDLALKIGRIVRAAKKDVLSPPNTEEYRTQLINGVYQDSKDKEFIDPDDLADSDEDTDE